jgi:uncharacterized protein (TIGR02099 family)
VIKRFGAFIWFFLVAIVVSLAVLLSVARVLLPTMSDYRSDLETIASKQLGRVVEIGGLDAGWYGLSPILALEQVRITSPGTTSDPLDIQEIHLALDLWSSLTSRRFKTRSIDLVGLNLTVFRMLDGSWSLDGSTTNSSNTDLDMLFQQNRLGLRNSQITWIDQMQGGHTRIFREVEAQLMNLGNSHQFSIKLELPASLGKKIQLSGEFEGFGYDPVKWSGRIYSKAEALQIQQWLRWFPDIPVAIQGQLSSELWGDWSGQQLSALSGWINGTDLSLALTEADLQPYQLANLKGRFAWHKTDAGWRVNADEVGLYRNEYADWSDIVLAANWNNANRGLKLSANLVPVEELGLIASRFTFVDVNARNWINRFEPGGLLQNFELATRVADGFDVPQMSVRTDFTDLSLQASDNVPGISGLAGSLEGNMQQGQLRLDSESLVMLAPAIFNEPLILTEATGEINWRRYSDRLLVDAPELNLAAFDGTKLQARSRLDWVFSESAPVLDMQVAFNDIDLKNVQNYLPTGVMAPSLVEWLNNALRSGKAKNARLLFQGRIDQMPFDRHEGVFQAEFDIEQATLDYSPEWGKLEELEGQAQFIGRSMTIRARHARLMHATVSNTVAKIDDLVNPVLKITGSAHDELSGMLNYVATTPLKDRFGELISAVNVQGKAGLDINLNIPLKENKDSVRVSGDVNFNNNSIKSKQGLFDLSTIKGRLHFNEQALSASGLKARLYDAPVSVALYQADKSNDNTTILDIKGPLQLVEWAKANGWKFANHLTGRSEWRTRLYFIRDQGVEKTNLKLRLDSDLQGIASTLPVPFKKPLEESVPLTVEWSPEKTSDVPVHIRYGDQASAVFSRNDAGELIAGEVIFGGGNTLLPKQNELHLTGRVSDIDPLEWAELFTGDSAQAGNFPALMFDLQADRVSLFDTSVQDIFIKSVGSTPWDLKLSGDSVEGGLQLVFDDKGQLRTVNSQLERLHLNPPPEALKSRTDKEKINIDLVPELSISINDFHWGETELGKLLLHTSSVSDGVDIKQLQLTSNALTITANGQWKNIGTVQSTRLNIDIKDGSLEQLLEIFGDNNAIEDGKLKGAVTAAWPGSPADFTLENLEGELILKIGRGRLKDVDTGAGRLLGLLSLQSIPRRLFLDFSDIFKKGYSFDKLEGKFLFNDGNAFTRDLKIYGPAADIEIVGRTGLVDQDYDELISVIPHLASALPIAGAIVVNPGVGAAVLLAERLLGDQVDEMSTIQYQVTGSWKDPQYTRFVQADNSSDVSPYDDDE